MILVLIPLVSGQTSYLFQKNSEANLIISCIDINNSVCGAGTECNLTVIKPNSDILVDNALMTNNLQTYNYSLNSTQTEDLGIYSVFVPCTDGTNSMFTSFTYEITRSGKTLTTSESLIYILLTFGIFFIFLLGLYFSIAVPYKNPTNMEGETINITRTKYIKMSLIAITYGLFVWVLNLLLGVANNYGNLGIYFGFLSFLFTFLINIALPIFIVIIIWAFIEILRDINRKKVIDLFGKYS